MNGAIIASSTEETEVMKRIILTIAMIAAGAGAANAYGSSTRDIDATQANQERRINQGLRDGSLTRREAAGLVQEQRNIQQLESRAKADGHISRSEHDQIRRAQDNASRHIYQERHDSETRGRTGWRRWW
jgi:uncharacterized membrane protein YebE (DUF533 family)